MMRTFREIQDKLTRMKKGGRLQQIGCTTVLQVILSRLPAFNELSSTSLNDIERRLRQSMCGESS